MTREDVQRNISPSISAFPPPDRGHLGPAPPPARRQHHQPQDTAAPSSQTAIFRAAAPPLIFAVLVAGLLVELSARFAPPPPPPLPGVGATVTVVGNTAAQSVLIWAEARWPGIWALPVLCAGALGVLRIAIWAGGALVDGFEERGVPCGVVDGVRVGRWEDGGSVSGRDLLAGVFT
jgi:hypothetical protein